MEIINNNIKIAQNTATINLATFDFSLLDEASKHYDLLQAYIISNHKLLNEQLNRDSKTKLAYKFANDIFLIFLESNRINYNILARYYDYLKGVKAQKKDTVISIRTQNTYLQAAKKLIRTAIDNILNVFPSFHITIKFDIDKSKADASNIVAITGLEYAAIEEYILKIKDDCTKYKYLTLLHLMAKRGLRQLEAVSIELPNIDFSNNTIKIKQKKQEGLVTIAVSSNVMNTVRHYVNFCEINEKYLFPSYSKGVETGHISTAAVRKMFTNPKYGIFSKVGVMQTATRSKGVHSLRHYTAMYLVSNNIDVTEVKDYMRHSDINTTMQYIKMRDNAKTTERLGSLF